MREISIPGLYGPVSMSEAVKIDPSKTLDCARCSSRGNRGQPISPVVGRCRACGYPYSVSEDGQWGWDGKQWQPIGTFVR